MGFQQGLSGLNAASKSLDTIGNNIANSGTIGFKSSATLFGDVYAASLGGSGQIGIGTSVSGISQQFTQGNVTVSSNPLDIAINGAGLFRLNNNGVTTWSRNGQFNIDKDGYVVNSSGYRLSGYLANALNVIVPSSPADIQIKSADLNPLPTGGTAGTGPGLGIGLNLDSREAVIAAPFLVTDPTTYNSSTSATVYDSLGNSHLMSLYFKKTAANTWNIFTNLDGGAASAATALTFSSAGVLQAPPASGIVAQSFAVATGATTPLTYNLNLTGSTQYGNTFGVNSITQDGYTSGRLAGLSVSSNGTVQGRYTNGQTRDLAQVVLGNFTNPNGLASLGANQWAETSTSGQPLVGAPGSGSLGVVQSGAVEESNVDMTAELVNMITQQRTYQANAQTIKVQDTIMQTLVNL